MFVDVLMGSLGFWKRGVALMTSGVVRAAGGRQLRPGIGSPSSRTPRMQPLPHLPTRIVAGAEARLTINEPDTSFLPADAMAPWRQRDLSVLRGGLHPSRSASTSQCQRQTVPVPGLCEEGSRHGRFPDSGYQGSQ